LGSIHLLIIIIRNFWHSFGYLGN